MSEICAICRDELSTDIKILSCNHSFHTECIDSWSERCNSCPFCRHQINDDYVKLINDGIITGERILGIAEYLTEDEIYDFILSGHINSNIAARLVLDTRIELHDFLLLCQQNYIEIIDIELVINTEYVPLEFKRKLSYQMLQQILRNTLVFVN